MFWGFCGLISGMLQVGVDAALVCNIAVQAFALSGVAGRLWSFLQWGGCKPEISARAGLYCTHTCKCIMKLCVCVIYHQS